MYCQKEGKKIRTHFGWRSTLLAHCPHCNFDPVSASWNRVWKIWCGKRAYSLFSCPRCGGFDLEVHNWHTLRTIARGVTEKEAEKLYVMLQI